MEWLITAGIIAAAVLVLCILWAVQLSKHTFRCASCSREFRPKWKELIFAVHSYDRYEIKCPFCGKKGCIETKTER